MERTILSAALALLVACGGRAESDRWVTTGGAGGSEDPETGGSQVTGGAATGATTGGNATGGVTTGGIAPTGGVVTGGQSNGGSGAECISGTTSPVACPGGANGYRICQYTGEWGRPQCPDVGGAGGAGAVDSGSAGLSGESGAGGDPVGPCVYRCVTVTRQTGGEDVRTVTDTTFDPCVPVTVQSSCTQSPGYSVSQQCALVDDLVERDCHPGEIGVGGSGGDGTETGGTGGEAGEETGVSGSGYDYPIGHGVWVLDGSCARLEDRSECTVDVYTDEYCGCSIYRTEDEYCTADEDGHISYGPCDGDRLNCDGLDTNGCEVEPYRVSTCATVLEYPNDAGVWAGDVWGVPICD